MEWGGRREEGSGWGTHVYLWRIHFDIWQNQYNIVKLKNKIKIKKNYFWLCWVFVAASRGHSLVAVHRLLIVVGSPVVSMGYRA